MARKEWQKALADALQKDENAVMQFATVDGSRRITPRVRTLGINRDFVAASKIRTLPLILSLADVRTPKVAQLNAERRVELVYWTQITQEQFRVLGRASIVPEPHYHGGPYPAPTGVVYDALREEGFDWEKLRMETFDRMSGQIKASWCRPVAGTPLKDEEEMKKWPVWLPRLEDAKTEEEKRNLAIALSNFAVLLIEPFEVDYMELGMQPERRTRFERDWEDESKVEFKEMLVVP